jgi:uroporphyrin-III C-methyltransferase/precorrin-2 dehydrogenase/sirohydrochlorin ferrochelatase
MAGDIEAAVKYVEAELAGKQTAEGFAWIVGAGPGDPELLTLKAARALGKADTILHDRLVAPAILELGRRDAEFISVGKQAGKASISQDEINALLVEKVAAGHQVCRLKGGDPFIFGRGGEEIDALENAGLPWQVIPGITAASGCAAEAGVPLTHREIARSVLFVTASNTDDADPDWEAISKAADTLVFYMAVSKLAHICAGLVAAGKAADCPALLIENGTTDRQRMLRGTLATLASLAEAARVKSPAVLLVGPVAELARLTSGNELDEPADHWAPAAKLVG